MTDAETLAKSRSALTTVCTDPALADTRKALMLDGAALLGEVDYQRVLQLEQQAIDLGYPQLN